MADPSSRSLVKLSVIAGPHTGHQWTFDRAVRVVLGRCAPAHLRLGLEPALSSTHCEFSIEPPRVIVVDLSSTNGTLVNGIPVAEAAIVDGDELGVGETRIRVSIDRIASGSQHDDRQTERDRTLVLGANQGRSNAKSADEASDRPDPRLTETDVDFPKKGLSTTKPSRAPLSCGPYLIEEQIGEGGMATVFRAHHRKTKEKVAIKLIRAVSGDSDKMLQLFVREASILLQLNHPRIVRSIELGFQDQQPFLVLEWLPVIDLTEFIDPLPGPQKVKVSCWVISRVLEALAFAHEQGFVHRDVKPSNILAYREAHRLQVKLGDFGLAKCFEDAGLSAMTDDLSIRGTLAYMSPEQLRDSRSAGPQSDLFSAGACLYRLLTGKHPKIAADGVQADSQVLREANLPPKLIHMIESVMQSDADARPQNVSVMYKALRPFHGK